MIGTYSGNLLNVDRLSVAHRLNVTLNDECSLLCMTKILLFKCRKRLDVVFSAEQTRDNYQVFTVYYKEFSVCMFPQRRTLSLHS